MSGSRAALRIARRDALRAKGRTALILCMIGLPVAAIVALGVVWKTQEWSPRESLPYEMGTADARLDAIRHAPVKQSAEGDYVLDEGGPDDEPWTTAQITDRVTAGYGPDARVLPMRSGHSLRLGTGHGFLKADLTELDARDPLARGIFEFTGGRAPVAPGELAVPSSLAGRFALGSTIQVDLAGTTKRVTGYVRDPRPHSRRVALAAPGAFFCSEAMQLRALALDL